VSSSKPSTCTRSDRLTTRYAIYYAPRPDEALAVFGSRWLGRDVERGAEFERPTVDGLTADLVAAATADPRHYGFHGTLKPPFALAGGRSAEDLLAAVAAFARRQPSFVIGRLKLAVLGDFIALVPHTRSADLDALAADCVRDFDGFRAPADAAELAKRRAARLTPRQDELLAQWGYPYVFDEFRFHLSLTGRLADARREAVWRALGPLTAPLCTDPVPVRDVVIFHQPDRAAPFRVLTRCPLAG
jgi:putative phosphonate metabolism protein